MKSMFDRDFWKLDNLRQTWEYKTISFMIRGFIALCVIGYLVFAMPSIYVWGQRELARLQPPSYFETLIDRGKKSGDFKVALRWLNFQNPDRSEYLSSIIESRSEDLPALFFGYNARHFLSKNDTEGMLFWTMFMRYRLRYDILRCGNPEMIERINALFKVLSQMHGANNNDFDELQKDPARLKKVITAVLSFDAKHPARNDPRTTCEGFASMNGLQSTPAPREEWADIRHTLRTITETSLEYMDVPTP